MAGPGSQDSYLHQLITVCHIKSLGIRINSLPPNEKRCRLAVSKGTGKLHCVAYYYPRDYCVDICQELVQYLTYKPVQVMATAPKNCPDFSSESIY
jgi:hypothetical protein